MIARDSYVIVEEVPTEERKVGSILLPDNSQFQLRRGRVLSVGPGLWSIEGKRLSTGLRVGDVVCYREIAAVPLGQLYGEEKGKKTSVLPADAVYLVEDKGE